MTKRPRKPSAGKKRSPKALAPARRKARAKAEAVAKRRRFGLAAPAPLDDFVLAAVRTLGITVEPRWLPAIRMNLETTLHQGALVDGFALPDEAEPAPVFEA